jgi:hypothetical protein
MTTTLDSSTLRRRSALTGPSGTALVAAAVAFNLGGALHPNDNGTGDKTAQLHDMLVQHIWYASHAFLLISFVLFTLVFSLLRDRPELEPATRRVVRVMTLVSALTTILMVPHLLAPLGADSIADGRANALSTFMTIDETLADAPWALGIALLALIGGVAGDLGNRVTGLFGVIGGISFATAAVTIPFTDTFDGLFPVGGMGITLWALGVVAVAAWRRRAAHREGSGNA